MTPHQTEQVRNMLLAGSTCKDIERKFGLSRYMANKTVKSLIESGLVPPAKIVRFNIGKADVRSITDPTRTGTISEAVADMKLTADDVLRIMNSGKNDKTFAHAVVRLALEHIKTKTE